MSRLRNIRDRFNNFMQDPSVYAQKTTRLARREERIKMREQNLRGESGIYKSDIWSNLVTGDYNPDAIGIATYKEMIDYDAQVISGLEILEMGVNVPWKIEHKDKEVVEYVTWALNRIRKPTFSDSIGEIMTAVWAGFSVTESVWEYVPDQKKYALRRELGLKTLDPETIKFFWKPNGALTRIQQDVTGTLVDIDLRRALVYPYRKKFGNWYGNSLLKAAYKNWFIKDNMLKFANIAFERFGAPIMLGIARDVTSMDDVEDVLSHLYARSVGVMNKRSKDDPTDIKILESKRASMPFMNYIDYHNRMILQRMLIGEPLLKGGGGTYGPRIPYQILQMRLTEIRRGLTGAIQDLLDLLTTLNFDVDESAKIIFAPPPMEDIMDKADEAMKKEEPDIIPFKETL